MPAKNLKTLDEMGVATFGDAKIVHSVEVLSQKLVEAGHGHVGLENAFRAVGLELSESTYHGDTIWSLECNLLAFQGSRDLGDLWIKYGVFLQEDVVYMAFVDPLRPDRRTIQPALTARMIDLICEAVSHWG